MSGRDLRKKATFVTYLCHFLLAGSLQAAPLETFDDVTLVETEYNDADSFRVRFGDGEREEVLRLYYVDCPETSFGSESDRRRVLEQSRYFGLDDPRQVIEFGEKAREFIRAQLAKPFVIHTAFARAMGRSKKPRIYALVETANGEDLGRLLIENGYARCKGITRQLPNGTSSQEYSAFLDDLEMVAGIRKRGIWSATNAESIAELRQKQRAEDRELDEALKFGVFSTISEDTPLSLNEASPEELQQLQGIGPELADRIVEARPFEQVEDLLRVRGIGTATLEKISRFLTVDVADDAGR